MATKQATTRHLTTEATPTKAPGMPAPSATDLLPPRLASITTRHRELMHRLLLGEPLSHAAAECGFTPSTAKYIAKSPLFRRELERMQTEMNLNLYDAAIELRKLQPKAIQALGEVADLQHRPDLRLSAAKEILDRTGLGVKKTLQIDSTHTTTTMSYEERLQVIHQGGELPDTERYVKVEGFTEARVLEGEELSDADVGDSR